VARIILAMITRLTLNRIQSSDRQGLILLFCIEIFLFASTFAPMIIAALPDTQTAGALATLLFSLTMTFNGYGKTL
jgi:ATP-binding cassette, subfamily G (WHITE), member 2, PDR